MQRGKRIYSQVAEMQESPMWRAYEEHQRACKAKELVEQNLGLQLFHQLFWVITAVHFPRRTSDATAWWPRFGSATVMVLSVSILRRQVSRRISRLDMKSSNMIGL